MAPISGVIRSSTRACTSPLKVAPMITAIASSTMLPRNRNFLNPSIGGVCSQPAGGQTSNGIEVTRLDRIPEAFPLLAIERELCAASVLAVADEDFVAIWCHLHTIAVVARVPGQFFGTLGGTHANLSEGCLQTSRPSIPRIPLA